MPQVWKQPPVDGDTPEKKVLIPEPLPWARSQASSLQAWSHNICSFHNKAFSTDIRAKYFFAGDRSCALGSWAISLVSNHQVSGASHPLPTPTPTAMAIIDVSRLCHVSPRGQSVPTLRISLLYIILVVVQSLSYVRLYARMPPIWKVMKSWHGNSIGISNFKS